jgi:phage tail sheath gpL-like
MAAATNNFTITPGNGWVLVATDPASIFIEPNNRGAWYLALTPATAPSSVSTQATGTLTLTGLPVAAETFVVGATTYTMRAAVGATANEVKIGASAGATGDNIAAAINAGAGSGTLYGSNTVANATVVASSNGAGVVTLTARTAGTAGNSIVLTESLTNATVSGAGTLAGAVNATVGAGFAECQHNFQKDTSTTGTFYIRCPNHTINFGVLTT